MNSSTKVLCFEIRCCLYSKASILNKLEVKKLPRLAGSCIEIVWKVTYSPYPTHHVEEIRFLVLAFHHNAFHCDTFDIYGRNVILSGHIKSTSVSQTHSFQAKLA